MTQKKFSKAVAAVLKANFPELGTQRDMEGGDTVDALNSLYSLAKRGSPLSGGPPADPDENPRLRFRVGRKLGTTIYWAKDEQPSIWVPNNRTLAGRITRLLKGGSE